METVIVRVWLHSVAAVQPRNSLASFLDLPFLCAGLSSAEPHCFRRNLSSHPQILQQDTVRQFRFNRTFYYGIAKFYVSVCDLFLSVVVCFTIGAELWTDHKWWIWLGSSKRTDLTQLTWCIYLWSSSLCTAGLVCTLSLRALRLLRKESLERFERIPVVTAGWVPACARR